MFNCVYEEVCKFMYLTEILLEYLGILLNFFEEFSGLKFFLAFISHVAIRMWLNVHTKRHYM